MSAFEFIDKRREPIGLLRIRYGSGIDDPLPFILTVTPSYVAHADAKMPPPTHREIQDYAERHAEELKAIAKNARDRGFNAYVLE
jgi:hypothetical protein